MSTATESVEQVEAATPTGARRWLALVTTSLAQLLITLDIMVVNVALPSAQRELHFDDASRAWVLTAYTLAFGSLMLFTGRLADRFGRRRMFLIGLIGVGIASAVGGLAPTFGILVASRAVQGVFAAMLAPTALALVASAFPAGPNRARAFGVFGTVSMAGGAIGLLLGGVLTATLGWRWTMFIGVAFAVVAIIGGIAFIDRNHETRAVRIDALSVVTVSLGLLGLVYGFGNAGEQGWDSPWTIASIAVGVVLIVAFVVRQALIPDPLLPLRILRDRDRVAALAGVFLTMGGLLSLVFFSMIFVQSVLGWSTITTGIAFLPQPLAVALASLVLGPRLNRLLGPKVVLPLALLLGAAGALILTGVTPSTPYAASVLPALVLVGLAGGLFFPTANGLATRGIAVDDIGIGSAVVSTSQQVGGTIAVAVINTVTALAGAAYVASHHVAPTDVASITAGMAPAFWWIAGLFALGAVICAVLLRRRASAAA
jgi:EmrB/QacA subfamily drug resistance transporter